MNIKDGKEYQNWLCTGGIAIKVHDWELREQYKLVHIQRMERQTVLIKIS